MGGSLALNASPSEGLCLLWKCEETWRGLEAECHGAGVGLDGGGGPLTVGPSVLITCLSLEAGPPKEYPPCMARRVSGGCHEPGIC